MPTINPLIDTLMHDVLGKRVGSATSYASINPVVTGEGIKNSEDDNPNPNNGQTPQSRQLAKHQQQAIAAYERSQRSIISTTQTISPLASLISFIEGKSQGEAVVQLSKILLSDSVVDAKSIAQALKDIIRGTGLFYESDVLRWFRNEITLKQLMVHPQFHGDFQSMRASLATEAIDELPPLVQSLVNRFPGNEEYRALVLSQMWLLLDPKLRWEGMIWAGVYAEIVFQMNYEPPLKQFREETLESLQEEIQFAINFTLEGMGKVACQVRIVGNSIEVNLKGDRPGIFTRMLAGRSLLEISLKTAGFTTVTVDVVLEEESSDE